MRPGRHLRDYVVGVVWILAAVGTVPALAKTVYVSKAGSDANDGLTWGTAKLTVQEGLNTAVADDQVWVAAGTYVENITLKLGVALYGGFAGDETELAQRNWVTNKTILDGGQYGSVVTSPSGATGTTRIDGFAIRNGRSGNGGGIYCPSSSPTIANNMIGGNFAAGCGGGIYCYSSSPMVLNNTITQNTARAAARGGGGISCHDHSAPMIVNNAIICNAASDFGGGVYCSNSSPTIANNTITANTVSGPLASGGAICCQEDSSPTIANNAILANFALVCGGGVYCHVSSPLLANNSITGNAAGYRGGGIYCHSSSATIANNTIAENNAGGSTDSAGGGVYCSDSSAIIANTLIAFNSSGIGTSGGSPALRYNCVYGNAASNYSGVTDPTGTSGNISDDPKLADLSYGNTHIQPDSSCANAGDDAVVQPSWLDIDSQSRIAGAHVDIGADESDGTVWPEGPYAIVRVSPYGDDANDGSSWVLAKQTLQAAIAAASALGGEVWVRAAMYPERITLLPYAHVYGGFAGTENSREARDWVTNPTILDGQQGGSVVTCQGGICGLSTIDGFTIRNGTGTRLGLLVCGGGIYCGFSSPRIANNRITKNTASLGAGIYCTDFSTSIITNNTVTGNIAVGSSDTYGGGICCRASSSVIVSNTIVGNTASCGGGIYCGDSSPVIANTIVAFNSSGIYRYEGGAAPLRYNCSYANTAYNYSGITDPTGTDGDISADPLFVRQASPGLDGQWGTADDDYGDLRLLAGSPCIDAGDNMAVPADTADLDGDGDTAEPIPFDLAGVPRFFDDLLTPDTGLGTPPIVDMGAYEYAPVTLQSSNPAAGRSLWRNRRNIIRLTFDADIAAPDVGAVMIQEMIAGGTYGEDLSAGFAFAVENDGQGQPRVLKIRETASSLQHRKWYAVRNTGGWTGVAPFTVQYVVQVGDANNDGRVLNTDFGWVNAAIPTFSTADDDRRDINGDGRILNTDFGVLNSKIPSFHVAKPDGH